MVDRGHFNDMSRLFFLDSRIRSQAPLGKKTPMPRDFQPDSFTVLCGRGKNCFNHAGNKRFRNLCELQADKYGESKSKIEKSVIVMSIVDAVREGSPSGGFVKLDSKTKQWYEVGDEVAREKVGQQLRDCLKARKGRRSGICIKKAPPGPPPPSSAPVMVAKSFTQPEGSLSLPVKVAVNTVAEFTDSHKCAPKVISLPTVVAASSNNQTGEASHSLSSASVVTKSMALDEEKAHCYLAVPASNNGDVSLFSEPFSVPPPSLVAATSMSSVGEFQRTNDSNNNDELFLRVPPSAVADMSAPELQTTARMLSVLEQFSSCNYGCPPTHDQPYYGKTPSDMDNLHCTTTMTMALPNDKDDDNGEDDEPFVMPPSLVPVPSDLVKDFDFSSPQF